MEHNLNNIEIGERIRSIRESMFMSREKFSEMIEISDVFLGQIERGECSLSLKTLTSIVAFSGSSADFILYGKDENDNTIIKKIDRMLKHCSETTLNFIYDLIHDVYRFDKGIRKNGEK